MIVPFRSPEVHSLITPKENDADGSLGMQVKPSRHYAQGCSRGVVTIRTLLHVALFLFMGAAQNAVGQLRTFLDPSFCVTGDYSVLLPLVDTPVFP